MRHDSTQRCGWCSGLRAGVAFLSDFPSIFISPHFYANLIILSRFAHCLAWENLPSRPFVSQSSSPLVFCRGKQSKTKRKAIKSFIKILLYQLSVELFRSSSFHFHLQASHICRTPKEAIVSCLRCAAEHSRAFSFFVFMFVV